MKNVRFKININHDCNSSWLIVINMSPQEKWLDIFFRMGNIFTAVILSMC